MRLLWQPTQADPADWEEVDSRDWSGLTPAFCHAVCVQGLTFEGADHYAVRNLPSGAIKVFAWHDDPDDWPPGRRWAQVVTVRNLQPDPLLGGAINTVHEHVFFVEGELRAHFEDAYRGNPRAEVRGWEEFAVPKARVLDGKWVEDGLHQAHCDVRAIRGWREWTEGLEDSQLDARGHLRQQRVQVDHLPPKGTRTYYHNPAAGPNIHGAEHPNTLGTSPSGATNETATINQTGQTAFSAVTPSGEPDSAVWPILGTYRCQLDVTAVGANLTFGLLNQGAGVGHFGRVNSGATADLQTFPQLESAFSSSGLHLATTLNPAWTAGSAADRFEVVVASVRVSGHGNQTMTMQLGETDDFADGPWAAAGQPARNAPFFGMMF